MISLIPERVEAFLAEDDGQPVVMLNLLRFKGDGGRETYWHYLGQAGPILARVGAEIVFAGDGMAALAEEDGQSWDAVVLVSYPTRHAFAALANDPDYAVVAPLRTAALEEGVLQPTVTRANS